MHPLDEWIFNQASTRKKLADNLGISEASLSRYLSGDRIPKPEIMRKIIEVTNGIVNPQSFYSVNKNNLFKKSFHGKHLLGIEDLTSKEITSILDRSEYFIKPF